MPLSYAALVVLTTRPTCQLSLASCLYSFKESLPSVPDVYGQSLEALPSQSTASGSESHVPGAVFKYEYPATVLVSDVPGAGTRVHTPAHGGFEAHDGLSDSILSSDPKPLEKHRPPPPQSVWSPEELSYPP
ncbi:hypothetical protein Tco_0803554 [Tanacetum coccineum]|uniref:Uncharacterized protein n=1 Tax=Tanacetum coccineum TaxID=301880 RepID=A0ABQ5A4N4_9ASTR